MELAARQHNRDGPLEDIGRLITGMIKSGCGLTGKPGGDYFLPAAWPAPVEKWIDNINIRL